MTTKEKQTNEEASVRSNSVSSNGSSSDKISKYRAIITEDWRGNARHKIADKILDAPRSTARDEDVAHLFHSSTSNDKPDDELDISSMGSSSSSSRSGFHPGALMREEDFDSNADAPEKADKIVEPTEKASSDIPVLYRDWEPKPEDKFVDVELRGDTEVELEKAKVATGRRTKRSPCCSIKFCIFLSIVLLVAALIVVAIVEGVNGNGKDKTEAAVETSQTESFVLTQQSGETLVMAPLHQTDIMNGPETASVMLTQSMDIPLGSTAQTYFFDECQSYGTGATNLTGREEYVHVETFQPRPLLRIVGASNHAMVLGVMLKWDRASVADSPLYYQSGEATIASRSANDRYDQGIIDLCVGIAIYDMQGKKIDYTETFVVTTWTNNNYLEKVRTVPVPAV